MFPTLQLSQFWIAGGMDVDVTGQVVFYEFAGESSVFTFYE